MSHDAAGSAPAPGSASASGTSSAIRAASGRGRLTLIVASMMLFSMFFGAGNLIFPPMLGAQAGESFTPGMLGFLVTGVVLPVLAVVAIAITGHDVQDLARRGGRMFGLAFPVVVYLSIGAFYALPRTATVSFSTAITPNLGWDSTPALVGFAAVFFLTALGLAFESTGIVDRLGRFLTPALLILLIVLITAGVLGLPHQGEPAVPEYRDHAFTTGFVDGYLTMDSLAALAFGIVIVSSLRYKGVPSGPRLVRGVSFSGVAAGLLLAAVYVGLGLLGQRVEGAQGYDDGATMLADAAAEALGRPGAVVFGLIVALACLTTAVGLLGATSEFFAKLIPAVSYRGWLLIFTVVSFLVSTMGLAAVLAVAGPIIGFIYPAAITLILLTLLEPLIRRRLNLTFRFALAVAVVWAAAMTLLDLGWGTSVLEPAISWSPGFEQQLGWVLPTLAAALLGLVIDLARGASHTVPVGGETRREAEARTGAIPAVSPEADAAAESARTEEGRA